MREGYRQITVESNQPIHPQKRKLIGDFLSPFVTGIQYEIDSGNVLNLFIESVDFQSFKSFGERLKNERSNEEYDSIIDEIVSAVDGVKSYGLKLGKRVYVGYNDERKVKDRKAKSQHRTRKRQLSDHRLENDFPLSYRNRIVCGDSLGVLRNLPDNCVDIMLTSPPYNFGLEYHETDDANDWDEYFNHLFAIFKETIRVLKHGGRMVVNVQPLFSDYIPTHHIVSKALMDMGMLWKGEILWEKNNYNCKYTAWGSWKSPSSPYLKYTWEFIEVFCKGSLKHTGNKESIDINDEEFKKWVYAKWSIAPERKMKEYEHPAMFPEALVERVLKLFSYRNDVVLDVFNGAGTTTYVAKILGRRYLGIDISSDYCRMAERRVNGILDLS